MIPTNLIKSWNITGQRVLVRADLNVPLHNGNIVDDFRLKEIRATLDYLLNNGATVILMTHIGRPKNHDPHLSTHVLIDWFDTHGYKIIFAPTIKSAYEKSQTQSGSLILLENLRFFPGETSRDQNFAQELAQLGDYYVNDAFGMLHRDHTSVTLVPQLFSVSKRSIGFLTEKTLQILALIKKEPKKPFILIVGGAKVKDKIPMLQTLVASADTIMLCPAIVFTFLKAKGQLVGRSLVDESMLDTCNQILTMAHEEKTELLFPLDYQIAQTSLEGPLSYTFQDVINADQIGISIGPKTIDYFAEKIHAAGMVFFNGAIGFLERPETFNGMQAIFQAMADSKALSIIAGGDSVAAAQILGFTNMIDHLITGGGAALAYLSDEPLPGLAVFE